MPAKDYNEYMRVYMLARYNERRNIALRYLGGKCVKCGTTIQLEFDHIDRNTKTANIAQVWSATESRFWIEIDKCQLLCKPCHLEKTIAEQKPDHGTYWRYRKHKCRCEPCKQANSAKLREWKQKRASVTERPMGPDL